MHFVYIIKSKVDGSYYVGETASLEKRLQWHNNPNLNKGFTKSRIPWEYHFTMKVDNKQIAKKIEKHIKRMKSREYLENLSIFSKIGQGLIEKYS